MTCQTRRFFIQTKAKVWLFSLHAHVHLKTCGYKFLLKFLSVSWLFVYFIVDSCTFMVGCNFIDNRTFSCHSLEVNLTLNLHFHPLPLNLSAYVVVKLKALCYKSIVLFYALTLSFSVEYFLAIKTTRYLRNTTLQFLHRFLWFSYKFPELISLPHRKMIEFPFMISLSYILYSINKILRKHLMY